MTLVEPVQTCEELRRQIEALTGRLHDAEQLVEGFRRGEVDSLVADTPQGPRVFTLAESCNPYRIFVEEMQHGAATLSPDGTVLYCNQSLSVLFRTGIERITGSAWHTLVADESAIASKQLLEKAALGRTDIELCLQAADGTRFPVYISANPLCVEGIVTICLVITDLTVRRQAEQALRDSEMRLRSIVETAVDGIITIDDRGNITLFNPAAARIFGYTADEVAGRNVSLLMPDVCSAAFDDHLREYLRTGIRKVIGFGREVVARRKDGSLFPMDLAVSETFLGERRVFTGIVRDISERQRVDDELAKARDAAEAANLAKSEFLANMSHEIRTPMGAILGFANMVVNKAQGKDERVECARIIERNARHLLALINEILDLSKIEAREMKVERVECDLRALFSEIISVMRPRAAEKGLEFSVRFDGPMPRVLHSDPMRLRQIVINLLGNAIKFTDAGSVRMRIADEGAGGPRIMLRVDVTDSGIGMSPDQLERLFRPFSQADQSITRKFGGTGLGLTISKRLAALLGGDISVISTIESGSTFTLKIDGGPSEGVEWLLGLKEEALPPTADEGAQANIRLHGRVLLVEDGRDNQRLLRMQLADAGANVAIAENGLIGVELATTEPFDLILMDMQMPVMDGYTATSELRRRGVTIPIIALTANAMTDDRGKCLASGCSGYLSKPVNMEKLLRTVNQQLGNDPSLLYSFPRPAFKVL
jgi:PAS domain S-box-containing protein